MPDLTDKLLPDLETLRLPGIDLPDDAIHPAYNGQSILNIPSSVCEVLGAPPLEGSPALRPDLLTPLADGVDTLIVILVDALALHRLRRWLADDPDLIWHSLIKDGLLAPITSILPSTTSAALPTLWTGASPARHGNIGYQVWLKEYGVVTNMIEHKPITYAGGGGSLSRAGFDPQSFLPVDSMAGHLRAHGITPHVFQHYSIIGSGLSEMFLGDAERHAVNTEPDLWASLLELMAQRPDERRYIWVYWGAIDGYSHRHGPDDDRNRMAFKLFSSAFEEMFLNRLDPAARQRTALVLTADHGQIATDRDDDRYHLHNHPDFLRMLHMQPTGDTRTFYLYVKPGQMDNVRRYIHEAWPGQFTLLDPAHAVENGLFGPGEPHGQLMERLGDLIVIARDNAYWWWEGKPNPLIGRHSGLSREEMLVPFLAATL